MVHGIHLNDESRVAGEFGAGDFGRRVRRLALDAHRILNHPDSPLDELIALHSSRVFYLLQEVRGAQSTAIGRWLLAVRREIGVKLQCWSLEDLEALVA